MQESLGAVAELEEHQLLDRGPSAAVSASDADATSFSRDTLLQCVTSPNPPLAILHEQHNMDAAGPQNSAVAPAVHWQ